MEHTDTRNLPEPQHAVLSVIAEASIPVDAKAIHKRAPLLERADVSSALAELTRARLVDRTDTAGGYIYELSAAGEALFTQQAKEALTGNEPVPVAAPPAAEPDPVLQRGSDDTTVEAVAASTPTAAPGNSLDLLLASINQIPPQRPADLDGLLVDLQRLIEGLMPRFPDVAKGLGKLHMYVDDAYPATK